jgi:hypothetical protein
LYALQGGVSRFNIDRRDVGDRGQGTADMIEFFQYLGQQVTGPDTPQMCVVSGRTHLLFDNTYRITRQPSDTGAQRRIIALNPENDFRRPPDTRCVHILKDSFPGTLISLRFFIDPAHLEAMGSSK